MENILISACLLGVKCRYDGESREYDLKDLKERYNLIPFCPEIYGGLPTPRVPSEINGNRVLNREGADVTAQYTKGAEEAVRLAKMLGCKIALMKGKSPSCGKGVIYDGNFSRRLISGDGITVKALKEAGIEVFTEDEIDKMV